MQKAEIEVGKDYGYREKSEKRGTDLLRVTIEDYATKGKWIALWHDGPNKGKRTAISSGHLVATWEDAPGLVKEESQLLALMEASDAAWSPVEDEPLLYAVNAVLRFTGELGADPVCGEAWLRGHLCAPLRPFERVCLRVGVSPDFKKLDPLGFVDREGRVHVGFEAALALAKRFAATEPEIVLSCIGAQTKGMLEDPEPVDWTVTQSAADAIARGWSQGRATHEGMARDAVHLADLEEDWIRPLREVQLLALRYGAERRRLRALLGRCAKALRKAGDRTLVLELDLLLGNPVLPDLNL